MPPQPALTLDFEAPLFLHNKTFLEAFNPNILNSVMDLEEVKKPLPKSSFASNFYNNALEQLEKYKKNFNPILHCFPVVYKSPIHKLGRVNPVKALGLTSFPKKIRNTLIHENYIDFDLSNAQPKILYDICVFNNIQCDFLTQLVKKRDDMLHGVMNDYNVSREMAKKLFIRLIFYGTFKGWVHDNNLNSALQPNLFIQGLSNELQTIATHIKTENKELFEKCKRLKEAKNEPDNVLGSFMSLYLQHYETIIMSSVVEWICKKTDIGDINGTELKALTYEYDGIKLLKYAVETYGGQEKLIQEMNQIVYEKTGFNVSFEVKLIEDFYEVEWDEYSFPEVKEEDDESITTNESGETETETENLNEMFKNIDYHFGEADLATLFYKLHGNNYRYSREKLYCFNGVFWEYNPTKNLLKKHISVKLTTFFQELNAYLSKQMIGLNAESVDYKALKEKSTKTLGAIESIKKNTMLKNIVDLVLMNIEKEVEFDVQPYLFAFNNRIFDFKINKFIKPEPEQMISITTGYDYVENYDVEKIKKVRDLLEQIYPVEELRTYALTTLASGLIGVQVQNFIVNTGCGGNGKSVISGLMSSTVGGFLMAVRDPVPFSTEGAFGSWLGLAPGTYWDGSAWEM